MRRVVLLALLALALPTAVLADSYDYANIGAGNTAIISGSASAGSTYGLTSALSGVLDITTNVTVCGNNSGIACNGWVSVTTGTLSACGSQLCFTGGTISITNNGSTLFQGTFTSGTVSVVNGVTFVNGSLGSAGGTTQITMTVNRVNAISGDTIVTPEPSTLGLLGTGLVGLAGIVRRKLRG